VPGKSRIEDVERLLGPPDPPGDFETRFLQSNGVLERAWGPRGHKWFFDFSPGGVLQNFRRELCLFSMAFGDKHDADEFERWFEQRLALRSVPAECASGFKPGATKQEHVIAAWGPCSSAETLASGGFSMHWGSDSDRWTLKFDADGTLVAVPERYRSGLDT
jgi:hypothetical protein